MNDAVGGGNVLDDHLGVIDVQLAVADIDRHVVLIQHRDHLAGARL